MSQLPAPPRLIIPIGDPAGIGPEVVAKALAAIGPVAASITVIGSRECLPQDFAYPVIDLPLANPIQLGLGNAASGAASFQYLSAAIDRTMAGEFDAIVTAPIAKSAWKAAGHHYPGQTELLAEKAGCDRFGMMFVGRSPQTDWVLRAILATVHIPLAQVPTALTPAVMTRKLELLLETLARDFGLTQPHIAIAGLNPHSGEGGQLGQEEVTWLQAWLDEARSRYPQVRLEGLIPPDTMWVKAGQAWFQDAQAGGADAYLALYHDQGLIPVKLMAFDRAVNTTIGLPFVRTSPDHGTAFDIAGKGVANPQSMISAIEWAIALCRSRAGDRA